MRNHYLHSTARQSRELCALFFMWVPKVFPAVQARILKKKYNCVSKHALWTPGRVVGVGTSFKFGAILYYTRLHEIGFKAKNSTTSFLLFLLEVLSDVLLAQPPT